MTHPKLDDAAMKADGEIRLAMIKACEALPANQVVKTAFLGELSEFCRAFARALLNRSQGQEPVARNNALRDDHPLSKGFCAHDVSMAKHCAACAKPPSRDTVVPAEQAEDSAMLDWLEREHFSLSAIKEPCGDDQFALWWQVTQGRKSISGHPLASPREAIRAAIGRNREAGGS